MLVSVHHAERAEIRSCHQELHMDITTVLIIVVVILLLGGGGWYGRGRWYGR